MTGTLTIVLLLLIKVLFATFAIGLVVGGIKFVKDYLFTEEEKSNFKVVFTGKNIIAEKKTCNSCEKVLDKQWKACPYCGEAIEKEIIIEAECIKE